MKIRSWDLFIFPLEELHCGYGVQQGNVLPSLDYIPGRVTRGGLANWAVRILGLSPESALFKEVFAPHTTSAPRRISFPWCTYCGYQPAPASLFQVKGAGVGNPHHAMVTKPSKPFALQDKKLTPESLKYPVDFLRRQVWPAQVDSGLKPASGFIDEAWHLVDRPGLLLDLKAPHEESGRVGKKEAALFAEDALAPAIPRRPEECFYAGKLCCEDSPEVAALFNRLERPGWPAPTSMNKNLIRELKDLITKEPSEYLIFLGRRRLRAVLYASASKIIDTVKDEPKELGVPWDQATEFTLTFATDYRRPFPLTADSLSADCGFKLDKRRLFARRQVVHGYDAVNDRKLPPEPTIGAGSCGLLTGRLNENQVRSLWAASYLGLGPGIQDGFGRFEINWKIHSLEGGDLL